MKNISWVLIVLLSINGYSQGKAAVFGYIKSNGNSVENINVMVDKSNYSTKTDSVGYYEIKNLPIGSYTVTASGVSFEVVKKQIVISNLQKYQLDFNLSNFFQGLDEVVITGTKTFKIKTQSPLIVNILDTKTLNNLQVCNLSEGLKFQPGLRVETDCQTCNYTQLRMNGLAGGYSQILINGRPIFSPLMGLYGMEQLPVNMIDRIEVIRGGGSSLYGSSAIGGTVNVITKIPKKDAFEVNTFYQNIGNLTNDYNLTANSTIVSENRNAGISFFMSHRERDFYDADGDNYSEIPKINNTSIGTTMFVEPTENQKIELSVSNLNEYRFGGEMVDKPAYLTQQSEERDHKIWLASLDYQINFNQDKSSFIAYSAWQNTDRKHYTGIIPDQQPDLQNHLENPPYGISNTTTLQGGLQLNHKLSNFLKGTNVLTFGSEYISDQVFDEIRSYNYEVDQHTKDFGTFLQSDWEILPSLNLLSGIRMDVHNLISKTLFSPRLALLYKLKNTTQFRLSYGTGFRAPQAFDTDLHIAFAGGGVSRVIYDQNLKEERSKSWSTSVNYDKATENFIVGFTLEGFYTKLNNAFILENIGADEFGEIFEKRNGDNASVKGITAEIRGNFNQKAQLEIGFTIQESRFDKPVTYINGIAPTRNFLRTPNDYGFANLTINATKSVNVNLNYVYTGAMEIAHFAGAVNQSTDEFVKTKSFSEFNFKIGKTFQSNQFNTKLELYTGMKNVFNSYQKDFDIEKNRDSNYVYGPAMPRSFFIGIKFSST